MSGGIQFIDIIFFAMVAVFLALRLRSVLGQRTGEEKTPPPGIFSPRAAEVEESPEDKGKVIPFPGAKKPDNRAVDSNFDAPGFLKGAKSAFAMIVTAFAKGETRVLQPLLSIELFEAFQSAIEKRRKARETLNNEIVSIQEPELLETRIENGNIYAAVKFISEQVNFTKDSEDRIVDGSPDDVIRLVDIWTFCRELDSPDPNWILVETQSEEG